MTALSLSLSLTHTPDNKQIGKLVHTLPGDALGEWKKAFSGVNIPI